MLERMHSNVCALADRPIEAMRTAAVMQRSLNPTKRLSRARKARAR